MRVLMAEAYDYRGPVQVGSHAIARAFAGIGARVCWLGTPLDPVSVLRAASDPRMRRRLRVWQRGGEATVEDVFEYFPFTTLPAVDRPFLRSRFVAEHTLRATWPRVASVLRARAFEHPEIAWLSPTRFSYPAWTLARPQRSACRLSDDWEHVGGVPASVRRLHDELVDRVDAVFVTSRRLADQVHARRPDAVYLPNGVSEAFFAGDACEPSVLARYPRPRVVFVGALDAWIDFDVIAQIGARIPRASVLVFGPGTPARRAYASNVHFMGPYPYAELPTLLRHCDVGLVPFVKSDVTHSVSPLKLFEYLAAGLATVATRLGEIEATAPPATLCDDADAFVRATASLLDGDPGGREARIAFAHQHTWSERFRVVRTVLEC